MLMSQLMFESVHGFDPRMLDNIEEDDINQGQNHGMSARSTVKRRINVFKYVLYID